MNDPRSRVALRAPVLLTLLASSACSIALHPVVASNPPSAAPDASTPYAPPPLQCPLPRAQPTSNPDRAPVRTAAHPPPPASGGTLLVTRDGRWVIAADPEHDSLTIVDARSHAVHARLALEPGAEPGRMIEDDAGRVYVVLRRAGAVLAFEPAQGAQLARADVCPSPRGITWEPAMQRLHVACASGSLVSLDSALVTRRTVALARDARDVVLDGASLLVTHLRSAAVTVVAADGAQRPFALPITHRSSSATGTTLNFAFDPAVAWRTIARPGGGALMLHQRSAEGAFRVTARAINGYYTLEQGEMGDPCGTSVTFGTVSAISSDGRSTSPGFVLPDDFPLAIDMALSPDGQTVLLASAAVRPRSVPYVFLAPLVGVLAEGCVYRPPLVMLQPGELRGQAVSVAFLGAAEDFVVQLRDPAALVFVHSPQLWRSYADRSFDTVALDAADVGDTGYDLFHAMGVAGMTCASCHPEGGDDGHRWTFPCQSEVRTQDLRGGLLATAPYHWDGAFADLAALSDDVFPARMGLPAPSRAEREALGHWLDALPFPAGPTVAAGAASDSVERGRALFASPETACTSCHSGPQMTSNVSMNVGTGGLFQVPSLRGVSARAPYLHNGCAATLRERFGPCGGGEQHGHTAALSATQLDDLTAYLSTL